MAVIAIYAVRWVVGFGRLSLHEGYKCLVIMLFCRPETNHKKERKKNLRGKKKDVSCYY